jgi:hypothetical protein
MIKILLCLTVILLVVECTDAQIYYPVADRKWQSTHSLMHSGRARGQQSSNEASRLRQDYKQIRKAERRMKLESRITSRETKKIYLRRDQIAREAHSHRNKKNMFHYHQSG